MGLTDLEINIRLVSDAVIRRYNKRYLRHDWATDVIAFPYFTIAGRKKSLLPLREKVRMRGGEPLGDILISTDTAKRQAREERHIIAREVLILAIHGTLHLVGYRDKTAKESARMWKKTEDLLRLLRV